MTNKSYVTVEQHMCPVCGTIHDTGAVLMDTRMRETFDRNTVTGWSLCPEHQAQADEGYIFLVGANPPEQGDNMRVEDADRTGEIISIKRDLAESLFNIPVVEMMFIEPESIEKIKGMLDEAQAADVTH